MVCTACGDPAHNVRTCPLIVGDGAAATDEDSGKRGPSDSPRTPAGEVSTKIAVLEGLKKGMSPTREIPVIPPLPGQGTKSGASGSTVSHPSNADIMSRLGAMMEVLVVK